MESSPTFSPRPCQRGQDLKTLGASTTAILLISFGIGCASPGPPRPPSLKLPEVVKDLSAERVGDEVKLHWTTPEKTTDHLLIKDPITAEICRIGGPAASTSAKGAACGPVKRVAVQPGASQTDDTLSAALSSGPVSLIGYRVQLLNVKGRSAGPSPEAFAAAGDAPPVVDQFRGSTVRGGAMLEWKKSDVSAVIELDRRLVGAEGPAAEPAPATGASRPTAKSTQKNKKPNAKPVSDATPKPLNLNSSTPAEIKLETPKAADAGGTVDRTVKEGATYRYTAMRVQSVTIEGRTIKLRSPLSAEVTVTMRDVFPPHVPSGLEAVPGGMTASDRSIDLSWTPNSEEDLAGYIVYRQEVNATGVAAGTATRLNEKPVGGPAYRDQTAVAGHRYAYRVTAVDTAGNESPPSAEVQETLREQ